MHILIMLILISLLILVHEFGHFISAKMFGVRVSKFALGLPIGPTLYSKKIGDTEFLIHAFLFGGYISFPDDREDEKSETEPEIPLDSPLRFKNKTPLQQAIIISAGVIMNVVFALFLVYFAAGVYQKLPSGNYEIYIQEIIKENPSNIEALGAKSGDMIYEINDQKITNAPMMLDIVKKNSAPKTMDIVLLRDGKEIELKNVKTNSKGLLGIKLQQKEIFIKTDTLGKVLKTGTIYVVDNTKMMVVGLGQLFTGKVPLKDLHGIVAITKVGGDIIEHSGLLNGLLLTAMISIDLALINILPIPALDGGHIMFLIIEKITRRELDEKMMEKINSFFFTLLLLLMVVILFNDILGIITKKF